MNAHRPDADALIDALRADLPSAGDEARLRARLLSAGAFSAGLGASAFASAATKSGIEAATAAQVAAAGTTANASAVAQVVGGAAQVSAAAAPNLATAVAPTSLGLLAKLAAVPTAIKLGASSAVVVLALGTQAEISRRAASESSNPRVAQSANVVAESARATRGPGAEIKGTQSRGAEIQSAETQREELMQAAPSAIEPGLSPAQLGAEPKKNAAGPGLDSANSAVLKPSVAQTPAALRATVTPNAQTKTAARGAEPRVARAELATKRTTVLGAQQNSDETVTVSQSPGAADVEQGLAKAAEGTTLAASSLRFETPLLEQAVQALHVRDCDAMRRALKEHARRYPNGLLAPERERIWAQGVCNK